MTSAQKKWIISVASALALVFFFWYFFHILIYIIIAGFLSLLGQPIVSFLDKLKLGRIKIPHPLNAFLGLLAVLAVLGSFLAIFIPIIAHQTKVFSELDPAFIIENYQEPIREIDTYLQDNGILAKDESIELIISNKFLFFFKEIDIEKVFFKIFDIAGIIIISFIVICFITFFFLKDNRLLYNSILLMTPDKYINEVSRILSTTKRLIVRYFWGLILDALLVMVLIGFGMHLIGLDNILIFAFIAGILNPIPFVGPTLSTILGISIGMLNVMTVDPTGATWLLFFKMLAVYLIINTTDSVILQPVIHSKSVKTHPLEIFLVILMSGYVGGIIGMMIAIPFYTFLRIIAKEFFNNWKVIRAITKNLNEK